MKYLNTRDVYLSTIKIKLNEDTGSGTFANDITFGGSLLGRLINSTIRKAKIQINYMKIGSIADEIRDELDRLLKETLDEEQKQEIKDFMLKALLEEIYKVVISEVSDVEKINQLLDKKEGDGLITLAVKYIQQTPDEVIFGGNKQELIDKLEKFRKELEELKGEEVKEGDDTPFYNSTLNFIQAVLDLSSKFVSLTFETTPNQNTNANKIQIGQKFLYITNDNKSKYVEVVAINPNGSIKIKDILGGSPFAIDENELKPIPDGTYLYKPKTGVNAGKNIIVLQDNALKTKNQVKTLSGTIFPAQYNELIKLEKINYLHLKYSNFLNENNATPAATPAATPTATATPTAAATPAATPTLTSKSDELYDMMLKVFRNSLKNYLANLQELVKTKNKNEIVKFGKQIMLNSSTVGKPATAAELKINEDLLYNDTAKGVSLLCRLILPLKNSKLLKEGKLSKIEESINKIIDSYEEMQSNYTKSPVKESLLSEDVDNDNEAIIDTDMDTQEEEETTPEITPEAIKEKSVKGAWSNNFKEGEEKEWNINQEKAKQLSEKIEDSTKDVDNEKLKDETSKDHILKIADLFGKAYRLYATGTIPSGRPNDRISGKTYREYKYIGTGTPNVPTESAGPGYGPWANIKVYNEFTDKISEIIQEKKYRKVFNVGTLAGPNGKVPNKGNVLLEFIRNMIDENTLKSYEANRTKLLNKYFGLKPDESISSLDNSGDDTSGVVKKTAEKVMWQQTGNLDFDKAKIGGFIALNVEYIDTVSKSPHHKCWIGQILKKDKDRILIKYLVDDELIPETYGMKITPENKYVNTSNPSKEVYYGLINLPLKEEGKFKMARYGRSKLVDSSAQKPDILEPTLTKKKVVGKTFRNSATRAKIARLSYQDKDGNDKLVEGTIANDRNKIYNDKPIGLDNLFTNMSKEL